MKVKIIANKLEGNIVAPASKSVMQRALALSLLTDRTVIIHNYGISHDDKAAINILEKLNTTLTYISENSLKIESTFLNLLNQKSKEKVHINCGESGLSARMFTSILSLLKMPVTIDGAGSITSRPMNFFDTILPLLDVNIQSNNGCLPLQIQGPMIANNITIDGFLSSQFLTGLLLAFGVTNQNAIIKVNNLKSKPYIDLTLKMMQDFECNVPENINYESFIFSKKTSNNISNNILEYTVEGDWSGAAFLLIGAAINGDITVYGLDLESKQADKKILKALELANATVKIINNNQISCSTSALIAFDFDASECPDLFPPLVALAANCKGVSTIKGTHRLIHKESNRALSLQSEFEKLGIKIELLADEMKIYGAPIISANVSSHNDHRIAMACAIAGLKTGASIYIDNAEAINKSYPNFYLDLQKLKISVETITA